MSVPLTHSPEIKTPNSRKSSTPVRIPERSFAEIAVALLLFAFSIFYLWSFRDYTSLNGDEGIVLEGADRILRGQVPYRDFFTYLAPGSYYLYAWLFRLFGDSMVVARTVLVVYGGGFSALIYLLLRRVCSPWISLLMGYLVLVAGLPSEFSITHNWDGTFLSLLAVFAAVKLVESGRWGWAFATGTLISLTCLVDQSKGAGLTLGLLLGYFLVLRFTVGWTRKAQIWTLALGAGILWPVGLTLAYFFAQHALQPMVQDLLWPLRHYTTANRVPYGYLLINPEGWQSGFAKASWGFRTFFILLFSPYWVVALLPFFALGILVLHAWRAIKGGRLEGEARYRLVLCSAAAGLWFSLFLTQRPDAVRIMFLAPVEILVLGWVLEREIGSWKMSEKTRALAITFLLLSFTLFGLLFLLRARGGQRPIETRRGTLRVDGTDLALRYVLDNVPAGGKMFVYPYHPLTYYLTATINPTPFDYLQPGMHTAPQFQQALSEVVAARTPVVLYDIDFTSDLSVSWPFTPLNVVASDTQGLYLLARYRYCRSLPWVLRRRLLFMVPREEKCPGEKSGSGTP